MSAAVPFHHTAAVFYKPPAPLVRGSYHTWELRTGQDHRAIYTSRVLSNDFIIGTYSGINFSLQRRRDQPLHQLPPFDAGENPGGLRPNGMSASFVAQRRRDRRQNHSTR